MSRVGSWFVGRSMRRPSLLEEFIMDCERRENARLFKESKEKQTGEEINDVDSTAVKSSK